MNRKLDLENGFPGEPPLGIDFDQLVSVGGRRVRRRRNAAVFGAASVAVIIVVGTSLLVPRLRESGASGGIPGCAAVLGPTSSASPQTSTSASNAGPVTSTSEPVATSSPSPASLTGAQPAAAPPSGAMTSLSGVIGDDGSAAVNGALTESDAVPTTVGVTSAGTVLTLDPALAQDGLTAIVWEQLNAQGASARTNTQLGIPSFNRGSISDPNTLGWQVSLDTFLDTPRGSGDFGIYIAYDGQAVPACHEGELDRRVTYPDGTVVDLTSGSFQSDTIDSSGATTSTMRNSVHAVAFHPDGTTVVAMSSDSLNFIGPLGETSGSTPVSLELVAELAANPNFARSSKLAAEVTETTRKSEVPDILGLTQDEAAVALQDAFFEIDPEIVVEPVADPAAVGKVVDQFPAAGQVVEQFGKVQVTIGGGRVSEVSTTEGQDITSTAATPVATESSAASTSTAGSTSSAATGPISWPETEGR